jgi:hypothetical protein
MDPQRHTNSRLATHTTTVPKRHRGTADGPLPLYRQHWPTVERSIAWLVGPEGRCGKLRYHGVAANDRWLHARMAALNLRHLIVEVQDAGESDATGYP